MTEDFTKLCSDLEHYETDKWAVDAILDCEIMTNVVLDPCAGIGVLAQAADARGYDVVANDIWDWGFTLDMQRDFLTVNYDWELPTACDRGFTVLMNPPFSKAAQFVEKCLTLRARKIICFQRFAWWESAERREFWKKNPPNRIYICGSRATCWRHDLPPEKRKSSSSTAHAWFIWERGQPEGTVTGHIYKK